MEIPACFERKKHKTGPTRVCDSCRFKIKSGAKLVEKLSAGSGAPGFGSGATKGPPPPPPGFLGHQRRPSSFASKCSTAGCTAATAAADGKCGAHTAVKGGGEAESAPRPTLVKRESDGTTVAQLHVPGGDTTLATIDVLLKKTAPQGEAYSYVFRGAPIPEAFFAVFLAKHLGTTLLIRPKRSAAPGLGSAAPSGPLEALHEEDEDGTGAGGVDARNNPFKRDLAKEAALAQQRAERARPKPQVVAPQFKRPIAKTVVRFPSGAATVPAGSKPKPPPVPGSAGAGAGGAASALAAGVSVDTVFKQRAKALFGQL